MNAWVKGRRVTISQSTENKDGIEELTVVDKKIQKVPDNYSSNKKRTHQLWNSFIYLNVCVSLEFADDNQRIAALTFTRWTNMNGNLQEMRVLNDGLDDNTKWRDIYEATSSRLTHTNNSSELNLLC